MLIDDTHPLVLGSGSPRRRDLIAALGVPFVVAPADVDESQRPGEEASPYLERVVGAKLDAVVARHRDVPHAAVLVADTIVVIDGQILGKPRDTEDAARLFAKIVGRTHVVMTRYAVALASGAVRARTVETRVTMRTADAADVEAYARSGEGLDKAGAYAAQGLGTFFIERIEGSYSNVIGLPASEVLTDLRALGLIERARFAAAGAR